MDMFCIKCGVRLPDDARFCPKCGFPVPESLIQTNNNEEIDMNKVTLNQEMTEPVLNSGNQDDACMAVETAEGDSTHVMTDSTQDNVLECATTESIEQGQDVPRHISEMAEFVGPNKEFYFRKWDESNSSGKSVSLNWAAFFLTGYWLGYRKMYLPMVIWLVLIIGFNIALFTVGYDHLFFIVLMELLLISINVVLGMFGNAIYYRHMRRKIKRWNEEPTLQSRTTLAKMGGTGWLAVILIIVTNVIIAIIAITISVVSLFNSGVFSGDVSFGTGSNDNGITGIQEQFDSDMPIFLQASFYYPIGTDKLKVLLVKQDGENEQTINKWTKDVDPQWESVYFNLYDPSIDDMLDPGHYIVRIYKGNHLLNKGAFDITPISIDGGDNEFQY